MSKALKRVEVLLSHWGGNKTVVVSVADLREVVRLAQVGRVHQRLADDANERIGLSRAPVSTAKRKTDYERLFSPAERRAAKGKR